MSTLPFYWVDAFTDRPFAGNPAAVVPLERWLPDADLQRMAAQHNLSETAYFVPEAAEGSYRLRWFTPAIEVDLCGHATLASAHVLFHERGFRGQRLTFASRSGPLHVDRGAEGRLTLDFPSRPPQPVSCPPALAQALGAAPVDALQANNTWLFVFKSAEQVRTLCPDHSALARIEPGRFIVTAPGADGVDFVSRFFAPDAGIPEDPVTGSAHCILAPYWADRLGKPALHARQVSARGGELWCELAGDRVRIAGRACTYLKGELRR